MLPCRSSEVRKKLVQEYDIKPIAHVRLLNGQELRMLIIETKCLD